MYKARPELISVILLRLLAVASLLIAAFPVGSAGAAGVQAQAGENGFYYYADGQRIALQPSLNWVAVKFASTDPSKQKAAVDNSGAPLASLDQARPIPHAGLFLLPVQAGVTAQSLVQGVSAMRAAPDRFQMVNPVFETPDAEMVVTDEFIAAFSLDKTVEDIRAINSSYGVELVEPILGQENTFVLKVTPETELDALAMGNLYQESGLALYAAPNFVRIKQHGPEGISSEKPSQVGPMAGANDFWYSEQYYLNNTGYYGNPADVDIDAQEAWDKTTGNSAVIIAVLDEGVDRFHEDLSGKMVPGYDATGGYGGATGGSPSGNDSHGTNVAGIAAATSNNSIGVTGVCRNCRIMPIRIAYDPGDGSWITSDAWQVNSIAFAYQNGAAVLNNSWGGGLASPFVTAAFDNAKNLGRNGMGSVVVVSAGNDNLSTVSYPGSLPSVIAVGASNMCDARKTPTDNLCNGYEDYWGSNYGSALDISAPGVWLTTTDITGFPGYSSGNYNEYFNGTSGAAPIVSGVAGLVLSINPSLTANDVQTILQGTADDVNGGGWDSQMGYGRVNANRAVTAAMPVLARDTVGVFRPSNGALYLKNSNTLGIADVAINYGLPGDYPVVGDWDGNGTATIGIYRNGTFYLRNSNTLGFADIIVSFGSPGDQPVAGDWNNDGIDTVGVYRSSTITFYLRNSNTTGTPEMSFQLGLPGDVGITGDWNGDGLDTTGVFRPSNGVIFLKNTNNTGFADIALNYGLAGDKPIMGDWNGDGIDTIGIYRNGTFYLRNSNTIGFADLIFNLGIPSDVPIGGNWDALP